MVLSVANMNVTFFITYLFIRHIFASQINQKPQHTRVSDFVVVTSLRGTHSLRRHSIVKAIVTISEQQYLVA
jgi:hypothetical protein